jgi:nicotinamide mononucleotide transporter
MQIDGLEVAANVFTAGAIVLAGRNSVHTWWTGIVGCTLFALVFYQAALFADVVLQVCFVCTSIYGWYRWLRGASGHVLPVTHMRLASLFWMVPAGFAATAAYGTLLYLYTRAFAPFFDSAVLVFSVIAQFLMMGRRIESWGFWLLVNTIAVPLYCSRGLTMTALLYAFFWLNAVASWLWWKKLAKQEAAARVAAVSPAQTV